MSSAYIICGIPVVLFALMVVVIYTIPEAFSGYNWWQKRGINKNYKKDNPGWLREELPFPKVG